MLLEEILEEILEEMNKQLIIYITLMFLYMLKIKELKKMLKEMMLFFVLQLQEIVMLTYIFFKCLNYNVLECYWTKFQFSVLGSGFSVLVPAPGKFNSLYRASDSLK
jgi:hypothetical protein